jgi:arylsulfatase A-like enzyme
VGLRGPIAVDTEITNLMPFESRCTRPVSRRQVLKYGVVSGLAAGVGSLLASCGQRGYRGPVRHVILISLDTSRPDHFACYQDSWIRTEAVGKLAGESILFNDHITPVNTTLASHVSLLTGKYPHNHGVPRNGFVINPANVMLPEILKGAGFNTAGFLGSFALDSRFDFAQGFDYFNQEFSIRVGDLGADQNQRRASEVTQSVIDYLKRNGVPRNLFLFAHYFDPHAPYVPIAPFSELYGGPAGPVPDPSRHPVLRHGRKPPENEQAMLRYAREITAMDDGIGRLIDHLRERKILDQSIVILTSDHGEDLSDTPWGKPFDHGWTVYEPEIRTMMLVRLPRGEGAGTRCDVPTSHIDLLPTLVRYLGLSLPAGVDGTAFDLGHIAPPAETRVLFSEATKPWKDVESDPHWFNNLKPRSARLGRYKYIRTPYRNLEELFDLPADPLEQRNLLAAPTAEQKEAAGRLRQAMADWTAAAKPLPTRFEPSQQRETIERLKSLGYL